MSGEDAPRPCLENLIVLEIKTNKQTNHLSTFTHVGTSSGDAPSHLLEFGYGLVNLVRVWAIVKTNELVPNSLSWCQQLTILRGVVRGCPLLSAQSTESI